MKPLTFYLLLITSHLLLIPSSLVFGQTADPAVWDALSNPPQTARLQVWRGDTVRLAPRWGTASTNGWAFAAYWSTNGTAWWSKSPSGTNGLAGDPFLWTPDMDTGAAKYRLFIRASNAGGASYRANAEISMLDSPGSSPALLPPPSAWPALAAEVLPLMLPYLPTYGAWTNEAAARASADLALQERIDAIGAGSSVTGHVDAAGAAFLAQRLASADSNWWVSVDAGTATLWRVTVDTPHAVVSFGSDFQTSDGKKPDAASYSFFLSGDGALTGSGTSGLWAWGHNSENGSYVTYWGTPYSEWWGLPGTLPLALHASGGGAEGGATMYFVEGTTTNAAGTYVTASELAAATASCYATSSNALAAANAAFSAAQASATKEQLAAATNLIVRTYFLSTNAWISADFSNQTVSVTLVGEGGTNTVEVGGGADAIDPQATNLLWIALGGLTTGLAGKADRDWGKYAPDGTANPDPGYMTFLNAPATWFASGCSWSSSGAYAVLTCTGTVAFASGSNGVFRIGPNSTNWFGYVSGGSVIVGAAADSLRVYGGGSTNGYAEIDYAYAGGDFPAVWYTPSLALDFTEVQSPAWVDNLDGTATVTVPAPAAAGFWQATTSVSFENVFESSMPARFRGGVFGATNDAPVVYDSTVTVTSGGHTYRIPAQLAE